MSAALVSEWHKVRSTMLFWILPLAMFAYMAFMAGLMAFSSTVSPEQGGTPMVGSELEVAKSFYSLPVAMGYVFPLVAGALAVTTEFRHRTLTGTLLALPDRTRVIGAKLVVQAAYGAILGVFGVAGSMLAAGTALVIGDRATMLGEPSVWGTAALSVLALALWGMVGVGFGSLVPNQIASIVGILAFTQFIEPIARIGLAVAGDPWADMSLFLPGAAAEALAGASLYSVIGAAELLPQWGGALTMLAYALGFSVLGRLITFRRDVT